MSKSSQIPEAYRIVGEPRTRPKPMTALWLAASAAKRLFLAILLAVLTRLPFEKRALVFVHVGKCGGKSVKKVLTTSVKWRAKYPSLVIWHTLTEKVAPAKADYVIVIRNPIKRALSAFNYRYAQVVVDNVDPRMFIGEREALSRYKTFNSLAEDLYANGTLNGNAVAAFKAIHHLGDESISDYLQIVLKEPEARIIAVLTTENLSGDAKAFLGLRIGHKHNFRERTPETRLYLSPRAISHLRKFLSDDYQAIQDLISTGALTDKQIDAIMRL